MPRIMALDYGKIRTGIAITDELQIIASGLTTVPTGNLMAFLENYFTTEHVFKILIGEPKQMDYSPSQSAAMIDVFVKKFKLEFPAVQVVRVDERFTSKMAVQAMIDSGMKKGKRKDKALIDEISATIMLRDYLTRKMF